MICNETKEDMKKCGIYRITNIKNGKVYVGSTAKSFQARFMQHKNKLKHGNHHSIHFQNAYNSYGTDSFIFEIEEILSVSDDIIEKETQYIEKYGGVKKTYNMCPAAGSPIGIVPSMDRRLEISLNKNNTNNLPGATKCKRTGKFLSKIMYKGDLYVLGKFITEKEAHETYMSVVKNLELLETPEFLKFKRVKKDKTKGVGESGFTGIVKHNNKWIVKYRAKPGDDSLYLGKFDTVEEAKLALENYLENPKEYMIKYIKSQTKLGYMYMCSWVPKGKPEATRYYACVPNKVNEKHRQLLLSREKTLEEALRVRNEYLARYNLVHTLPEHEIEQFFPDHIKN